VPTIWIRTLRRWLPLALCLSVPCLAAQHLLAGSSSFPQSVTVGSDGKPSLQFTNDSGAPIFAYVMVEFPSLGMEGRTYFDFYTSSADQPIRPGVSITRGLSHFTGSDVSRVRAEVRAVIFQNGSSAGDPVWVNAILARRLRFYDRSLSLHDLLIRQLGTEISREGLVKMLRVAQEKADNELPDDDLRVMDDTAFYGAISTFDKNRQAPVEVVLKRYLAYLGLRTVQLERSLPALDTIRGWPVVIPKPLSDASLPADFRASAAAANLSPNSPAPPSSCTVNPAGTKATATPTQTCSDSDGDTVTQNNEYTFEMEFSQYNAGTKKDKTVTWTSPANQGPFNTTGVCVQFNDCDDTPDVYYIQGMATGVGCSAFLANPCSVDQGQTPESFYWSLDRYPYPTFSQCDECDIDPGGKENPVSTNAPVSSTVWYFDYSCTVTAGAP
jgi:hypothetical protein